MHIFATFMRLRPDAVFTGGRCDPTSLETLAETYTGTDVPSQFEMETEWAAMVSEKEDERQRMDDIHAGRAASELKKVSVDQALAFVGRKVRPQDAPQTQLDGLKTVVKEMLPFILNGG